MGSLVLQFVFYFFFYRFNGFQLNFVLMNHQFVENGKTKEWEKMTSFRNILRIICKLYEWEMLTKSFRYNFTCIFLFLYLLIPCYFDLLIVGIWTLLTSIFNISCAIISLIFGVLICWRLTTSIEEIKNASIYLSSSAWTAVCALVCIEDY